MIDVTDRLVSELSRAALNPAKTPASSAPNAAIMFAKMAAHHSDQIAAEEMGLHDFDHALNFQALATCLSNNLDPSISPSFEEPLRPDHEALEAFRTELMNALNLHQAACLRNGLWRMYYDAEADCFYARLGRRRRLSALRVIDNLAQHESLDLATGGLLSRAAPDDDIYFALASSAEHLQVLAESTPESWAAFNAAAGFTSEELTAYAGFLEFLSYAASVAGHSLLYREEKLLELGRLFSEAFNCTALSDQALIRLTNLFSLPAATAAQLSLPVPFFRVGGAYLRYHGFSQIMSPAMGLLTIAVRKHDSAWSRTLGTTLVRAADAVAASLPKYSRLEVAVRRGIKDTGDIDLALYDTVTRHLLVCEVKTVYDKHRTVHQMHRIEEAKVNISRAVDQLRRATTAINAGELGMGTLFGRALPAPLRIDSALLTWVDPIDLTIGTDDEAVLSVNFATLRYLIRECAGDIAAVVRSVTELRNTWCMARLRPLILGQPRVRTFVEAQLPVSDTHGELERLGLSAVTLRQVGLIAALYPDSLRADQAGARISYLDDTRRVLAAEEDKT